ncbi:MAG TPA: hypothetical protein VHW23_13690 [Kofleriaceae bacterium]|jgi:hypothetical protein|nr:hypothetical protein [Kofleriaceae bacterium]
MKLTLALIAILAACGVDTAEPAPGAGGGGAGTGGGGGGGTGGSDPGTANDGDPGDGTGPVTTVSGHIAATTTWTDVVHVTGALTVDPGVTLHVAAGTTVDVAVATGITVLGTLDIQGTKPSRVAFRWATPGDNWYGIAIPDGGAMTASYLIQIGGGTTISGSGKVTLVDSQMSHAGGDFLVMSGGTLDMTYSQIGVAPGQSDNTHCDMHVEGPVTITATHSSFTTSSYGLMFYGGSNADFRFTNWIGNSIDIDRGGAAVTGNFSDSYFASGAPSYAGFTMQDMAPHLVADAGVR